VTPGVLVHARPLTVAEARRRIERAYEPYHLRLGEALDGIRRARGFVLARGLALDEVRRQRDDA
jgi:N-formylglutamate amidohydrolase